MPTRTNATPNPRRVAAGRRNRAKRRGLTAAGRAKLRETALANKPWEKTTGPRTPEGKKKVALNGKRRQRGPLSEAELRAELSHVHDLLAEMATVRRQVLEEQ